MKCEFILMGCSVSSGVPSIGNDWGACDPAEPKNRRDRPCAVVRTDRTTVIIDTGPDFRGQMNALGIKTIDAVLYTHSHSDHIQGIDELRVLRNRMKKLVDIYGNEFTINELHHRFSYLFTDHADIDFYPQVLNPHIITPPMFGHTTSVGDIPFTPYNQDHGAMECVGFRFGNLAYSSDMVDIDDKSIDIIKNVDVWIADGAGFHQDDHKTHASLNRLYELNRRIGAKKVYVSGLSKFMDYKTLKDELPPGFEPAYDGLRIEVSL